MSQCRHLLQVARIVIPLSHIFHTPPAGRVCKIASLRSTIPLRNFRGQPLRERVVSRRWMKHYPRSPSSIRNDFFGHLNLGRQPRAFILCQFLEDSGKTICLLPGEPILPAYRAAPLRIIARPDGNPASPVMIETEIIILVIAGSPHSASKAPSTYPHHSYQANSPRSLLRRQHLILVNLLRRFSLKRPQRTHALSPLKDLAEKTPKMMRTVMMLVPSHPLTPPTAAFRLSCLLFPEHRRKHSHSSREFKKLPKSCELGRQSLMKQI
ncbi:hypothetical protein FGO68_gene484 [Halteria grandinella]|uniref:Uncharacterized protein n=1 Tax=Halteria grandinella TaxID=5974 RepID=A0A8J8NTB5_HALGN|nr:hypothetical protein FGO68_gene484 [Halteria grandinella]